MHPASGRATRLARGHRAMDELEFRYIFSFGRRNLLFLTPTEAFRQAIFSEASALVRPPAQQRREHGKSRSIWQPAALSSATIHAIDGIKPRYESRNSRYPFCFGHRGACLSRNLRAVLQSLRRCHLRGCLRRRRSAWARPIFIRTTHACNNRLCEFMSTIAAH